ncbi:MAG: metallophosphoesterase [bacterium]|nr:metallophosphoesterase [bacterium]
MKLGVMADSHDNVPMVRQAVEVFDHQGVDLVIHAGDFISPFAVAPLAELDCRVVAVFGNNDGERVVLAKKLEAMGEVHPNLAEVELGGRKIAAMHYPELAEPIAASGRYDLVIYGHTHEIDVRPGTTTVLNPGETGAWLTGRATVAIVDLGSMEVEIVDL